MGLNLGVLDILGAIPQFMAAGEARKSAQARAGTQLTGGYSRVGGEGQAVPQGGLQIPPDAAEFLSRNNAEVGKAAGFGILNPILDFFGTGPPKREGGLPVNIQSVDEANALVDALRKSGNSSMADDLAAEFNRQLGVTSPTSPGVREYTQALESDYAKTSAAAEEDWARQQEGLGVIRSGKGLIDASRLALNKGTDRILAQAKRDEEEAVDALDMAKVSNIAQLSTAMEMRRQVMSSFQDQSARALETQRGALDSRHRGEEEALRNRMANDPAFANRPDQQEAQIRALRFGQREELSTVAGNLIVQQQNLRLAADQNTAQLVAQSAGQTAAGFANIGEFESNARTHYNDVSREAELNRVQNGLQLNMLEREGRTQEANYIRSMSKIVVPHAPIMALAMQLQIATEDRANALKWGSEADMAAAMSQIGNIFNNLSARDMQKDQLELQQETARKGAEMQGIGLGIQAVGTVGGLFKPGAAPAK
jgi:hypothetical protein